MTKVIVGAVLALAAITTAVADNVAGKQGCQLVGSYVTKSGESAVQWTTNDSGTGDSGTAITDVPAWPNIQPPARVIPSVGAWRRAGGNTFAFTQIFWIVDETGTKVRYFRNSGTETLTEDCNVLLVDSTLELFSADDIPIPLVAPTEQNPNGAVTLPTMRAYRVVITPPVPNAPLWEP